MKKNIMIAAAITLAAAINAGAQDTSQVKPKPKDSTKVVISNGAIEDTLTIEWYVPTGKTCSTVDATAAKAVTIKSELYKENAGLITPDSAKVLALCAVPGQVTSGEMNVDNGRTTYAITVIPNEKKTHAKVVVDAMTGAVLSSKQFGGLRGIAGWVRESGEHKMNKAKSPDSTKVKPPTDTTKPPV